MVLGSPCLRLSSVRALRLLTALASVGAALDASSFPWGIVPGSVTIEIAPPMVLRPNSVPCGPLSTSMRSTSGRSWFAPTERAR